MTRQIDTADAFTFPVFETNAVRVKFCVARTWGGDEKSCTERGGEGVVAAAALTGFPPLSRGITAKNNRTSKKVVPECAAPCLEGRNFRQKNRTEPIIYVYASSKFFSRPPKGLGEQGHFDLGISAALGGLLQNHLRESLPTRGTFSLL